MVRTLGSTSGRSRSMWSRPRSSRAPVIGHREGDAQAVLAELLDVVGRVTVRSLGNSVNSLLKRLEAEQERAVEERQSGHVVRILLLEQGYPLSGGAGHLQGRPSADGPENGTVKT